MCDVGVKCASPSSKNKNNTDLLPTRNNIVLAKERQLNQTIIDSSMTIEDNVVCLAHIKMEYQWNMTTI